jgi:hypothetical protein
VRLEKAAWICFATSNDQEAVVNASASIGLGAMPIDALKDAAAKGDLSTSWSANKSAAYSTEVTDGGTPLFLALRFKRNILKLGAYDFSLTRVAHHPCLKSRLSVRARSRLPTLSHLAGSAH